MRAMALAAALMLAGPITGCAASRESGLQVTTPTGAAIADAPVDVAGGAYVLDSRHVSVLWRVKHMGLSNYTARLDRAEGTLNFNAQAPSQSSLNISIDANSVSTGLLDKDGQLSFDKEIAKTIGAEKTPKITFVSTQVVRTGEKTGQVTGDLTMNGITKPATLDVTFEAGRVVALTGKSTLAFSARGVIKRSDWDVTNWAMFTSDEVELIIEAEFLKS